MTNSNYMEKTSRIIISLALLCAMQACGTEEARPESYEAPDGL